MDRTILWIFFTATLMAAILCSGCTTGAPDQASSAENGTDKLVVAVSILPQADFVEKIGGDRAEVIVMIPPGGSPATYEPTSSQMAKLSDASLYMALGSGVPFENTWMDKLRTANRDMVVVNTSEGVELMTGDPHIWLSPKQAIVQVENIYRAMAQADPENKDYYYQNKENYVQQLEQLDSDITGAVANSTNRSFMVFHPAWGYYARDYGLEMLAVEQEGKEPSPADIQQCVAEAKEKGIKVVFVQTQFSQSSANTIADEIGGTVIAVDPLGKDYLGNMRNVTETFVRYLE